MAYDAASKCSIIQADSFLSIVEFCPFESACDLLAYGSNESLSICSLLFQLNQKTSSDSLHDGKPIQKSEKLMTFDFKGTTCLSWSPSTNMKYLPRYAKFAIGMQNSGACIVTTDFKEDTKVVNLSQHKKSVNSIAFEPVTGTKLVSVSDDHTCLIWNAETGDLVNSIKLLHAGINVCWNVFEPGKLMIAEQSGRIRFYDMESIESGDSFQPILCLEADSGTLVSCHWSPSNSLHVGAVVGNEWVLWNIGNVLPEESRQAHSGGCTLFRWSHHNEDVFLTQGRPKHTTNIHHLGHRELLFQDTALAGSGASWHATLPVCAVACNNNIKVYDLTSSTQT